MYEQTSLLEFFSRESLHDNFFLILNKELQTKSFKIFFPRTITLHFLWNIATIFKVEGFGNPTVPSIHNWAYKPVRRLYFRQSPKTVQSLN